MDTFVEKHLHVRNNVHIFAKKLAMITTTATEFRANIRQYFDAVINDCQEVIISRGKDSAVLISLDEYNSIKETEYLMSSKAMQDAILKGMEDVSNGNYKIVDVNEL